MKIDIFLYFFKNEFYSYFSFTKDRTGERLVGPPDQLRHGDRDRRKTPGTGR